MSIRSKKRLGRTICLFPTYRITRAKEWDESVTELAGGRWIGLKQKVFDT